MKTLHKVSESFDFEKAMLDETELGPGLRLILKKVAYVTGYSGLDDDAKSLLDFRAKNSPKVRSLLQLAKFNYLSVLEKKRTELESILKVQFIPFKKPFRSMEKDRGRQSQDGQREKLAAMDELSSKAVDGVDQKQSQSPYFSSTIIKKESRMSLKEDVSIEIYEDSPKMTLKFNTRVTSSIKTVDVVFLDEQGVEKIRLSYVPGVEGDISETEQLPQTDLKQVETIGIKLISKTP